MINALHPQKRKYFVISFEMPPNASSKDATDYLRDAIGTMRGSYRYPGAEGEDDPGASFWSFDPAALRVRPVRKP